MRKKRILITGSRGFIGRNLCEYLAPKYTVFAPPHAALDLLSSSDLEKYIKRNRIEVIIHGANVGGGRDTVGLANIVETNLRMFFNVIRNTHFVAKIINFGSGAEYDKARDLKYVAEEEFDRSVPKDSYGFYKYICSKCSKSSKNIITLRLFGVYGKYENYLYKFISNTIVKNLLRSPIDIGQNVFFDYLYIDDLVKIVEYFIRHSPKYEAYNVAAGNRVDLLTIAKIVNKISDYHSEIKILHKGLNFEYTADNRRLVRELGNFEFVPFEMAIESLYKWYKINLRKIDRKKVEADPYIKKIKIKA